MLRRLQRDFSWPVTAQNNKLYVMEEQNGEETLKKGSLIHLQKERQVWGLNGVKVEEGKREEAGEWEREAGNSSQPLGCPKDHYRCPAGILFFWILDQRDRLVRDLRPGQWVQVSSLLHVSGIVGRPGLQVE